MMCEKEFIQNVEQKLMSMDGQALLNCLRAISKQVPTDQQEAFLQLLTCVSDNKRAEQKKQKNEPRMSQELVDEKLAAIEELIKNLEDDELAFEAWGYEDYSESYWDSDWVWEYSDPDQIGSKIMKALDFAEECVNDFRYKEAVLIFDMILDIEVSVVNEADYMTIDLCEMRKEELISVDLKRIALLVLYANYQLQKPEQRAEVLYSYIAYPFFKNISIEAIFRVGREILPDEDRFWQDWIKLLSNKTGESSSRMLTEALMYYEGADGLAKMAGQVYEQHPSLYLAALEEYERNHKYEQMETVGREALEKIDKKLKIRAQIALKTSFAAQCIGNESRVGEYWMEAFVSDTTVSNYLRFYQEDKIVCAYGDELKALIKNTTRKDTAGLSGSDEMAKNMVDNITYTYLEFFSGEFGAVRKKCVNPQGSLGWSGKFIGKGIRLFLLYLFADSQLDIALNSIAYDLSGLVNINGYRPLGELLEDELSRDKTRSGQSFWFVFSKWREYFPMQDKDKQKYLLWVEDIVEKRTRAIVGGKFRNHYGSVALLICALGEVKASLGKGDEKKNLIIKFKKEFPRHSAFHGELQRYSDRI